jgi:hypothetical protein
MYNANYRFLPIGRPNQQPDGTWSVTGAYTISNTNPQLVVINSEGPFSNLGNPVLLAPGMPSPKRFDLGTGRSGRQLGAVILLHEAGHLTHVFGADTGSEKLQNTYTRQVLKGCF